MRNFDDLNTEGYSISKIREIAYKQGKEDALKEMSNAMYDQCFVKDNPPDMQKWDGGNWFRYKLFENVMGEALEQLKGENHADL